MKRFFLFFLFVSLILFSCSLPLLKKHKEKDRIYISDIINILTKFGFFENKEQLIDETIVFYTMDTTNQILVPSVPVQIISEKDTSIVVSDSSARLYFKLKPEYFKQNTYLKSVDPGHFVFFTFNASGYRDTVATPSIVKLKDYHPIYDNGVVVFSSNKRNQLARDYLYFLKKQYNSLKNLFGFSPMNWGLVLAEEKNPIHFFEPLYLHNDTLYSIFAYSISSDSLSHILLVNIHEWCETILKEKLNTTDPYIRWFRDGIPEFSRYQFLKELSLSERKKFGFQKEAKQELLKYYHFLQSRFSSKKEIPFDLTKWPLASINRVYKKEDMLGYPLSLYFWIKIQEKYGTELITQFIQRAIQTKQAKHEDYIQLLSELTGENIKEKLRNFQTADILSTINKVAQQLNIALEEKLSRGN